MSKPSLSHRRHFFKELRQAAALPNPMRSEDDYLTFINGDLVAMSRTELGFELTRVKFMLMLERGGDTVIAISPNGDLVTAQDWLLKRLDAVAQLIGGDV